LRYECSCCCCCCFETRPSQPHRSLTTTAALYAAPTMFSSASQLYDMSRIFIRVFCGTQPWSTLHSSIYMTQPWTTTKPISRPSGLLLLMVVCNKTELVYESVIISRAPECREARRDGQWVTTGVNYDGQRPRKGIIIHCLRQRVQMRRHVPGDSRVVLRITWSKTFSEHRVSLRQYHKCAPVRR